MIDTFVEILGLIILAAILQDRFKIPSPLTLISAVVVSKIFGWQPVRMDGSNFDSLVLLTLPILIAADALKLDRKDLREHSLSLFWIAVISVLMAVATGLVISQFMQVSRPLPAAAVVLLFSLISATDPITVTAIFSNFTIPHKLKVITEGESLFNDATALLVFTFALTALSSGQLSLQLIAWETASVVGGAVFIGMVMGIFSVYLLQMSDDSLVESVMLIFVSYVAYIAAEKLHWSGILAVIVTLVIANERIHKMMASDRVNHAMLPYPVTSETGRQIIPKIFQFVAMGASGLLFISMATLVDVRDLVTYWKEIVSVFIASTLIRGLMIAKFAMVSGATQKMQSIPRHWWAVLTFAGSKGALSILMVHMIPDHFAFKKLFEAIVIGNIVLSTFVYAIVLAGVITWYRERFALEVAEETAPSHPQG